MPTPGKEQIVSELEATLKQAGSAVLLDYRGLTHREMEQLRAALREKGAQLRVIKDSLLRLALTNLDADVEALGENLLGPTAVAFGFEQPAAPAQVLTEFARQHEACQIKPMGLIGTQTAPLDLIRTLRGREEYLGEFIAFLNAPLAAAYQTVASLGQNPLTTIMGLGASPLGLLQGLPALKEQQEAA